MSSVFRAIVAWFQHTAARRRLPLLGGFLLEVNNVSTHSRAEAAAYRGRLRIVLLRSFNTQPRGGGCARDCTTCQAILLFQHTAARRRLPQNMPWNCNCWMFQHTAARRRLQRSRNSSFVSRSVSTHSRAEAAAFSFVMP